MFLILLFKLLTQFPIVSFSLLLFSILNPLSSPSPPSLLSVLINSLSKDFKFHYILFHQWHIFLHSVSHQDMLLPACASEQGNVIGLVSVYIGECGSTLYVGLSGIVRNLIQKSTETTPF